MTPPSMPRSRHRPSLLALALCGIMVGGWAPAADAVSPSPVSPRPGPSADLRADVNHDGTVDVTADSDEAGEHQWTAARGAVFLPNVDDDSRRCRVKNAKGKPLSDAALARCHDGADTIVNGPADAEDLARLRTVPAADLADSAVGRVKVTGPGARHTRIFARRGAGWVHLRPGDPITAGQLRQGLELGIEGIDIIRDRRRWDGTATVQLTVTTGANSATDTVRMRVAPLLTHHHLQAVQQVLVTAASRKDPKSWKEFVPALKRQVAAAGISAPLVKLRAGDPWAQDFVEPMYASIPAPGGRTHGLRILMRSHQQRPGGRALYRQLRGPGIGVVQVTTPAGDDTLDSMGNLETIPPYTHAGRSFPAGRIIMGQRKGVKASPGQNVRPSQAMRDLLAAQGLQSPLLLDTSWLGVGHVDEFIQFLPAPTARGWQVAVADPDAGLGILREAKAQGHGKARLFSVPARSKLEKPPATTINRALASKRLVKDNALAARKIRENLEVIQRETGVTDTEIVRIPALYTSGEEPGQQQDTSAKKLQRLGQAPDQSQYAASSTAKSGPRAGGATELGAEIPGAVNGVLLNPTRYLAPRQWGPVIAGKDIFGEAVSAVYRAAGLHVAYIDDFYTYHAGGGEVHCGTNTLRDIATPWWTSGPAAG